MRLHLFLISLGLCSGMTALRAQVQIDKPIQLTGGGSNAHITGIESVPDGSAAPSAASIQENRLSYAPDNGTANAYDVDLSPAVSGYVSGMIVHFIASNANTGPSTLSVNGGPAAPIRKLVTSPLAANDIRAGQAVSVMYDGTHFQMLSALGNAGGGAAPATDMAVNLTLDKYTINTTRNTANNPVNVYTHLVSGTQYVPVTLSVSGLPAGVSLSFAGPSGGYPFFNTGIIFAVDNSAAFGSYTFTFTATGGVAPASVNLTFNIVEPKLAFTTSGVFDGNLGGISGANAICQSAASAAGLPGTYKAWLSTSASSPSTAFGPTSAPYTNVLGQTIAGSWDCLINNWGGCSGQFMNPNNLWVDEYGNTVNVNPWGGGTSVWSATLNNGTWLNYGHGTCGDWTSNGFGSGDVGNQNGWSSNGCCQSSSCSTPNRLYCFQQ